ncbi:hypothetical protein G5C51_26055 [Streptomyces sp. A7024]|uniref:Uncharacterized protein n=1 Tax=Streptomyces coryli TaxID=1128680 RepID=A0A6G4U546_9ACTN|nr:hypothetical protein [Streptomyces coryli]NGN67355.1 hypothetical protein [Streptomyces coryli]
MNTDSVVKTVPSPKLRAVADRVVAELQLAADKVAVHHSDRAKYPMPKDPKSAEAVLATRFGVLPEGLRKQAADKVAADLKATATRAKRYGDLAHVDLRSPASVGAQAGKLKFPDRLKFPPAELGNGPETQVLETESAAVEPEAATAPLTKLSFRIHKVKCVEETNELGKDEFYLGGNTIDESGDVHKVSQFKVMSCHSGDVKTYLPPREFSWFNIAEAPVKFPKGYFVVLGAAEKDGGGFADYLDKLLDLVKTKVIAAVAAAIGGIIGAPGGPITAAIGACVGYVVGKIFDFLKAWWGDDVFAPKQTSTVIASLTARWTTGTASPQRTVVFSGHGGKYEVVYDWQLHA